MTGRPRRLHGFFSQRRRIATLTADRDAAETVAFKMAGQVREAREAAAKAEAVRAATESVIDAVRQALAASLYFAGSAPDDVVGGVERVVKAHRDLTTERERLRGERDRVKQRADDRVLELDKLRLAVDAYRTAPTDQAAQDRRNAVLLCDALALSEGRHLGQLAPALADEKAAKELLEVVREAVFAHLGADLERAS